MNVHPIFAGALRAMSGDAIRAAVDGRAAWAKGNHLSAQNDEREPAMRRAWMAIGAAEQIGHPACELCDFLELEASEGDPSRPDGRCTLNQSGGTPEQCAAINPRCEVAA